MTSFLQEASVPKKEFGRKPVTVRIRTGSRAPSCRSRAGVPSSQSAPSRPRLGLLPSRPDSRGEGTEEGLRRRTGRRGSSGKAWGWAAAAAASNVVRRPESPEQGQCPSGDAEHTAGAGLLLLPSVLLELFCPLDPIPRSPSIWSNLLSGGVYGMFPEAISV